MDPAFPYLLPAEPELLALAYAADRSEVLELFRGACARGELHLAQRLTDVFGLGPDDARAENNAACSAACAGGHASVVGWLADTFRLDIEDARADDNAALRLACKSASLATVRRLVACFGLTAADAWGGARPALQEACMGGHLAVVCWLVARFGLPEENNRGFGDRVLTVACTCGRLAVARWLIERGQTAENARASSISFGHAALINCHQGFGRWSPRHVRLPEQGADRVIKIAIHGSLKSMQLWTVFARRTSVDIRTAQCSALRAACVNGYLGIARWLTARFGLTATDVRAGDSILGDAAPYARLESVRWLVEYFRLTAADVRVSNCLVFRWACLLGRLATAGWLAARFSLSTEDARAENNSILRLANRFDLTVTDVQASNTLELDTATLRGQLSLARWLSGRFGLR